MEKIYKFGKGTINLNGFFIYYFRIRVINSEENRSIFNKYDINYVETKAFKKYKHCADPKLVDFLETNLVSMDYNNFEKKSLNIHRALREVALNKLHKKYDFIYQMDKFNWNTDTEYAECTEPMF